MFDPIYYDFHVINKCYAINFYEIIKKNFLGVHAPNMFIITQNMTLKSLEGIQSLTKTIFF